MTNKCAIFSVMFELVLGNEIPMFYLKRVRMEMQYLVE